MSQDSVSSTCLCHYPPRFTTRAKTLWSDETALWTVALPLPQVNARLLHAQGHRKGASSTGQIKG